MGEGDRVTIRPFALQDFSFSTTTLKAPTYPHPHSQVNLIPPRLQSFTEGSPIQPSAVFFQTNISALPWTHTRMTCSHFGF